MSSNENSCFIDRSIMKEVRVYIITRYNPVFFMIPVLFTAFSKNKSSVFQTLSQIFDTFSSSETVVQILKNSQTFMQSLELVCDFKNV